MADAEQLAQGISEAINMLARALSTPAGRLSKKELGRLRSTLRQLEGALRGFEGWASPELDLARAQMALPRLRRLLDEPLDGRGLPDETLKAIQEAFEYLGGHAFAVDGRN
jgi:hypothetical protein